MSTCSDEVLAKKVYFQDDYICIILEDDRIISTPYRIFPRLAKATKDQLNNFKLIGKAEIHWDELDEHLSIEGFLDKKIKIAPGSAKWKPHSWKERFEKFQQQQQKNPPSKQPEQQA